MIKMFAFASFFFLFSTATVAQEHTAVTKAFYLVFANQIDSVQWPLKHVFEHPGAEV